MSSLEKPKLTSILDSLSQAPIPPTSPEEKKRAEFQALPEDEKFQKAWNLKCRGIPILAIARMFGVSVRTIHRWLQTVKQQYREQQLEGITRADLLADDLMFLSHVETTCMYEANQLGKDGKELDPKTGKLFDNNDRNAGRGLKIKFIQLALKARDTKIKLELETGMLPREPGQLYRTMEQDGKVKDLEERDKRVQRSRKELLSDVLSQMEKTQVLE